MAGGQAMSSPPLRVRFQPTLVTSPDELERANATFAQERVAVGLRWSCASCAYFDPAAGGCSVGWPNGPEDPEGPALAADGSPMFCKAFEDMQA